MLRFIDPVDRTIAKFFPLLQDKEIRNIFFKHPSPWTIFLSFTLAFTLTGCLKKTIEVSPLDLQEKETPPSFTENRPIERSDLSSHWEFQEEERSYTAAFVKNGDGSYNWQNGKMVTTQFADRLWLGTWYQTGNDREGGFEVLVSEDGNKAEGVWWYTRVGDKKNIPQKEWGGPYTWIRLPASPMINSIQQEKTQANSQSFPQETKPYQEKP